MSNPYTMYVRQATLFGPCDDSTVGALELADLRLSFIRQLVYPLSNFLIGRQSRQRAMFCDPSTQLGAGRKTSHSA